LSLGDAGWDAERLEVRMKGGKSGRKRRPGNGPAKEKPAGSSPAPGKPSGKPPRSDALKRGEFRKPFGGRSSSDD